MYGGGGHPDIGRLILEKLKPIFGQVENEDSSITCVIRLQEFLGCVKCVRDVRCEVSNFIDMRAGLNFTQKNETFAKI